MSDASKIEWTDATWNPVRGCVKVSPGCKHCYAERFAERFRGVAGHPFEQGFDLRLVPHKLEEPLAWTRPRRVFVNSMSDLFQEEIPDAYVLQVLDVIRRAGNLRDHVFQVLTKRDERLRALVSRLRWTGEALVLSDGPRGSLAAPLMPFLHLGVSVEDRKFGVPRIAQLQATPAALRFLSIEPLLENLGPLDLTGIGWVIVGGESGNGVRPMHPDWVRSIRDQCVKAGVPFFFKQWGAWYPEIDRDNDDPDWRRNYEIRNHKQKRILNLAGGSGFSQGERVHLMANLGKGKTGRLLDGRTWDEMPAKA
jgi:protein gp37